MHSTNSGAKPFYSIIVPTFNRAHLLPFAVESLLQQSFGDFEIVISNGGSTDNTVEAVRGFDDPRIRYFESDRRLTAAENYQCGLNNARGEYITFLSDDDAYTPQLLAKVKETFDKTNADIVGYGYARYYHDELYDFERYIAKNSLAIHKFDGKATVFSSTEAVNQAFVASGLSSEAPHPRFILPYLSNATYHRDVFDKLLKVRTNLFDFVPPDIYLATAVFYVAAQYVCIDLPLLVWSSWAGNMSLAATRKQADVKEHYRRLMNGRALENTPLKFAVPANCSADCTIAAAKDLGDGQPAVDWSTYFKMIYENSIFLRSTGVDLSVELDEFERVLAEQTSDIQKSVNDFRTNLGFKAKSLLNVRSPRLAAGLRRLLTVGRSRELNILSGDKMGFSNVLEAGRFALRPQNDR